MPPHARPDMGLRCGSADECDRAVIPMASWTSAVVVTVGLALAAEAEAHVTVAPAYRRGRRDVCRPFLDAERTRPACDGRTRGLVAGRDHDPLRRCRQPLANPGIRPDGHLGRRSAVREGSCDVHGAASARPARRHVRVRRCPTLRRRRRRRLAGPVLDAPGDGARRAEQRTGRAVVVGALGLVTIAGGLAAFRAIDRRRRAVLPSRSAQGHGLSHVEDALHDLPHGRRAGRAPCSEPPRAGVGAPDRRKRRPRCAP